jgi:hypothetical protein
MNKPVSKIVPVLKLSSLRRQRALNEKERPRMLVISAGLVSALDNMYNPEGITAKGKRKGTGVRQEKDRSSVYLVMSIKIIRAKNNLPL